MVNRVVLRLQPVAFIDIIKYMAGLYRRLTQGLPSSKPVPENEAARPSQEKPDPESSSRPTQAAAWAAGEWGEEAESSALGISVDEQVQIIGRINEVLRRNRIQIREDTFSFAPKKRDFLFPVLANAAAAALTLAAAALLLLFFDRSERTLVNRASRVLSAEGKLLEAFKKQSAEQMEAQERQISEIQARLQQLARERDRLKLDAEARIHQREAELRADLERRLAEQRQKLEREGSRPAAIERELKSLESRLIESNQRALDAFRRQSEEQLAAREAALTTMARQYNESLQDFQRQRAALEQQLKSREAELQTQLRESSAETEQLAQLREERRKEQLVYNQLLSGYEKVRSDWLRARYDEALQGLDSLQELLSRESVLALPAIRIRLPVERFTIDSLRRLIDLERAGVQPERSAPSEADSLREQLKRAQEELRAVREDLRRLSQEAARLQAEARRRAALEARLRALRDQLAGASKAGPGTTQAEVLALLETKLRVRQVLSSEPVKGRHPGLDEQLERYLDAFGREQRQEGASAALSDALAVLEGAKRGGADPKRFKGDYSGGPGALFARLLDALQDLLR